MTFVRRTLLWMATAAFSSLLFLAVSTASIVTTFRPDNAKAWLEESGAYGKFVDAILSESQKAAQEGSDDTLPLNDPAIQDVAKTAFSPTLLQQSTESFIDGTFAWLDGEVEKPSYVIDFTAAKNQLAEGLGNYARVRFASLPVCTAPVSGEIDIFTVTCRPAQAGNVEEEINKMVAEIKTGEGFLPNPSLTAESITVESDGQKIPLHEQMREAPRAYQLTQKMPYVLGGLAAVAGIIIVLVSSSRRRGLKRVAKGLLLSGVIIAVTSLVARWALDKAAEKIQPGEGISALQRPLTSIAQAISNEIANTSLWLSAVVIIIGIAVLLVLYLTRSKDGAEHSKSADEDSHNAAEDSPNPADKPTEHKSKTKSDTPGKK